ncbi:MAG: DUF4301 family protein [Crocinitomicaceae bacterium]|nr:DUF4301 family protein [Crocinitomicaceae bacterium]
MSIDEKSSIINQKRDIFVREHYVSLMTACSIGDGIIRIDGEARNEALDLFREVAPRITFFIPASGSGSRMFKFLFDYTKDEIETDVVKKFFDNLDTFAFYQTIPINVRQKMSTLQSIYLAEYLLNKEGMNFTLLPKGLIPFHKVKGEIYNPFQEQVLQSKHLMSKGGEMHFTVQEGFEGMVRDSIESLGKYLHDDIQFSFSSQEKNTDAYCFNSDGSAFIENNTQLRRPAGHGALIHNLNEIEADFILVKNIDNVQHFSKKEASNDTWELALGTLIKFKQELRAIVGNYSKEAIVALNSKYDFLSGMEMDAFDEARLSELTSRPSRVCGMVKNEGALGGGPFWINDNGVVTKQIIEGVQISGEEDQQAILKLSSHFNPVFIALSKTDVNDKPLDLMSFIDASKNLVVTRSHKGSEIMYRELPGLWNGAMSDWNTIFLEIPVEVFSPVKTANDLLKEAHRS